MKCNILPLIHKFKLGYIKPQKFYWGWRSQKEIRKMLVNTSKVKYQPTMFNQEVSNKMIFNEHEFEKGSLEGYNRVWETYSQKKNFLKYKYTTPELSLAINHIIKQNPKIRQLELDNLKAKVLTSWIEIGTATGNDKFLGHWDIDYIKDEIKKSNLSHCWDIYVGPLKQRVKVLYSNNDRKDIWEWERCLMTKDSNWTISNINEIITA